MVWEIETILNENMDVATSQYGRVHQLLGLFNTAIQQNTNEHFKPEKRHPGWMAIESRCANHQFQKPSFYAGYGANFVWCDYSFQLFSRRGFSSFLFDQRGYFHCSHCWYEVY